MSNRIKAKLAILATQFGIPVPDLLDAGRRLLKYECKTCDSVSRILRCINDIGAKRAEMLIKEQLK